MPSTTITTCRWPRSTSTSTTTPSSKSRCSAARAPTSAISPNMLIARAERGVRHGQLMIMPVEVSSETHGHGGKPSHAHSHAHVREAG